MPSSPGTEEARLHSFSASNGTPFRGVFLGVAIVAFKTDRCMIKEVQINSAVHTKQRGVAVIFCIIIII
jgi:hypothetical protein